MTTTFGKKRAHVGSQKPVSLKNNPVSKELEILMRAALNFLGVSRTIMAQGSYAVPTSQRLHSLSHCTPRTTM